MTVKPCRSYPPIAENGLRRDRSSSVVDPRARLSCGPTSESVLGAASVGQVLHHHEYYDGVPTATFRLSGLFVLGLAGDLICALTRFESTALPWFGLPRSLP